MALRPSPPLWIALVFILLLTWLWETLLITGCVPPLGGNASIVSNFHIMELVAGTDSVRFGYIAFCTLGDSQGKPTQICNAINAAMKASPDIIASKLPNVNPALFNVAFFLNRTAFPILPAPTLALLVLAGLLMIAHYAVREKNHRQASMIMAAVFGCLGIALLLSLAAAVSLTLTTSAIANITTLSDTGFTATRGEIAFRLHWVAFANILLVTGVAGMILPHAGGKGGYGGGGYGGGDYYD